MTPPRTETKPPFSRVARGDLVRGLLIKEEWSNYIEGSGGGDGGGGGENNINAALMALFLCATMKMFTATDSVLPNGAKIKNMCRHEESVVVSVTHKTKNSHKVGKVTDSR